MPRITAFTSIVGMRGALEDEQAVDDSDFVAFVDRPWQTRTWRLQPAFDRFKSPQRNAMTPKLLAHQFLTSEYSVWIESNVRLRVPPSHLVSQWLGSHEVAVLAHRKRTCIYDEAVAIAEQGAADPAIVAEQMKRYRSLGVPERGGVPTTRIMVRRHCAQVERFNEIWFLEYTRFVAHDQLPVLFAARESGCRLLMVPPSPQTDQFYAVTPRPGYVEPQLIQR